MTRQVKEKRKNNKVGQRITRRMVPIMQFFPSKFCARLFSISQGRLLVPHGIENNSHAKFCGKTSCIMRNVKVANLYSLLTGLPVGRVEGEKVLSARFVFRFILTGMKT